MTLKGTPARNMRGRHSELVMAQIHSKKHLNPSPTLSNIMYLGAAALPPPPDQATQGVSSEQSQVG